MEIAVVHMSHGIARRDREHPIELGPGHLEATGTDVVVGILANDRTHAELELLRVAHRRSRGDGDRIPRRDELAGGLDALGQPARVAEEEDLQRASLFRPRAQDLERLRRLAGVVSGLDEML